MNYMPQPLNKQQICKNIARIYRGSNNGNALNKPTNTSTKKIIAAKPTGRKK